MLIECPDCGRSVSDRAKVCPQCACPISEVIAEQRAQQQREEMLKTRRHLEREVDCPKCEARGFYKCPDGYAEWCIACEHSGRLALCAASNGYFAVARYAVERFVAGELHPESSGVVFFVGEREPKGHRYPNAAPRHEVDPDEIPW
jgi:hypothetical protein